MRYVPKSKLLVQIHIIQSNLGRLNSSVSNAIELIRQSQQFPFIFNVKIHPRLEQQWLELRTRTAGQFLMYKRLAGSNQYLSNMNHLDAWY